MTSRISIEIETNLSTSICESAARIWADFDEREQSQAIGEPKRSKLVVHLSGARLPCLN